MLSVIEEVRKGKKEEEKKLDDLVPSAIGWNEEERVGEHAEHKLWQNHYRGKQSLYSNWLHSVDELSLNHFVGDNIIGSLYKS